MPKVLKVLTSFFLFILLTAGYYSLFYTLSLQKIGVVERYFMNTGLEVITAGINRRVAQLEVLANDWSYWDESYNFMAGINEGFYQNELSDETLTNMGVNIILFYNNEGRLIHKKTISFDEYNEVIIPAELLGDTGANSLKPLIQSVSKELDTKKGIIHTPNGNLFFAISPILKSNGDGPAVGTMLMGRYINKEDEDILREGVGLDLFIRDYVNVPAELAKELTKNEMYFQRKESSLVAYKVVKDYFNTPAFWMEFYYPKVVYDNWVLLIKIFAAIASAGTIFSGSIFIKTCKIRNTDSPTA